MKRSFLVGFLVAVASVGVGIVGTEWVLREKAKMQPPQRGVPNVVDPVLGWIPRAGKYEHITEEFHATHFINDKNFLGSLPQSSDASRLRIVAVGDSHTFGVGVSTEATWPKVLEKSLLPQRDSVVYNLGVSGYSLHQYYFRLFGLMEELKPQIVILGFSMATDLFDLRPPQHGGWLYGSGLSRDYFDFDDSGALKVYRGAKPAAAPPNRPGSLPPFSLSDFELYKKFRRSPLALILSTLYRPGGKSLWAGTEVAVSKELDSEERYSWELAEAILVKMKNDLAKKGVRLVVLNIPYLAQVYDSVWRLSFGLNQEKYSQTIGATRLERLCRKHDIVFLDSTPDLKARVEQAEHWVHYKEDGHPTEEGHEIIGKLAASGIRSLLTSQL